MNATVSIPLWLFALLLVLAVVAGLQWFLLPGVRWYFRRKVRRVLDEIQLRLKIELPQFKLTRRRALIDRLMSDPRVMAAAQQHGIETGKSPEAVKRQVLGYAREIVPAFNAYVYFRVGYWLAKTFARLVYRVRLGYTDDAAIAAINPKSTVVFVMNHRSNMDYIVASYLAAERAALSYAVGEWARIWGLQQLIRAMGAYFVRRNAKDELYRRVLERYIAMATEAGVTQAVYPEGGLSRDGKLRAPRFGVIDYMLRGFRVDGERDLVFVPLGLNYDRVLEDRTLLRDADGPAPRTGSLRAATTTLRFIGHQLGLMLRSRWHRFGYACVNFGTPVSVRAWTQQRGIAWGQLDRAQRQAEVAALGQHLMAQVGALVPVLPVPLVAMVLLADPQRALSLLELKAAVGERVAALQARGAQLYVPRQDWDYAVDAGLRMLTQRRLVDEHDGLFVPRQGELPLLRYYANSIVHLG